MWHQSHPKQSNKNRRQLSWRGMAQSLEVIIKWLSDSYGSWHFFICSDQCPVFPYWPQVQSQQHQSMDMILLSWHSLSPGLHPWDGDPTIHKWHIYKSSLMEKPQWSSWRLSDALYEIQVLSTAFINVYMTKPWFLACMTGRSEGCWRYTR